MSDRVALMGRTGYKGGKKREGERERKNREREIEEERGADLVNMCKSVSICTLGLSICNFSVHRFHA